jgi:hypothetical protein
MTATPRQLLAQIRTDNCHQHTLARAIWFLDRLEESTAEVAMDAGQEKLFLYIVEDHLRQLVNMDFREIHTTPSVIAHVVLLTYTFNTDVRMAKIEKNLGFLCSIPQSQHRPDKPVPEPAGASLSGA